MKIPEEETQDLEKESRQGRKKRILTTELWKTENQPRKNPGKAAPGATPSIRSGIAEIKYRFIRGDSVVATGSFGSGPTIH